MKKRNYWPLFFIGIFSFVFSMIIWTIYSTSQANIDEDKSFMKKYQDVDASYNEIINSNKKFNQLYDLKLVLNDKSFDLKVDDIMYSQRVLEKISKHKDIMLIGANTLKIFAIDKTTNIKKTIDINLKVTKSSTIDKDIMLNNSNFTNDNNVYVTKFNIDEENNWNITGTFNIDGNAGYIYIKTNARKK
ncbi:hypothetical protein ACH5BF_05575 [Arcobacter sp. YIC-464]|uniref:hypothetical protein n=1 Tax=Arcobacter sp. YIC-464 TaxID=3376631 RepID=UPI003C1B27A5